MGEEMAGFRKNQARGSDGKWVKEGGIGAVVIAAVVGLGLYLSAAAPSTTPFKQSVSVKSKMTDKNGKESDVALRLILHAVRHEVVKKHKDQQQIDVQIDLDNNSAVPVSFKTSEQTLQSRDGLSYSGEPGTVKLKAKVANQRVTISFRIPTEDEPTAIHLRIAGKKVRLALRKEIAPSPTTSLGRTSRS